MSMGEHKTIPGYQRVTVNMATEDGKGKPRTCWGVPISEKMFKVTDREGVWTGEFFVGAPADYLKREQARMNLHYGELEVIK
jgi:hypothetical protein